MRVSKRITCLLFLVCGVVFPVAMEAQSAATTPGTPQTDRQNKGEALFFKNCALCHIFTNQKKELNIQASTELIGLFKKPTVTEAAVRQVLRQGVPGRMPTFEYALQPGEIDDLIAYLRIR